MTQKLFDIPYSHRHLAFRKVEVEGEQEVSAELSSQNSAKTTADKRVNKNLSEKDLKWVDYSTNEVHPFSNSELKATKMDSQVSLQEFYTISIISNNGEYFRFNLREDY